MNGQNMPTLLEQLGASATELGVTGTCSLRMMEATRKVVQHMLWRHGFWNTTQVIYEEDFSWVHYLSNANMQFCCIF